MQNYYSNTDVQSGIVKFYNKIASRLMNGISFNYYIKISFKCVPFIITDNNFKLINFFKMSCISIVFIMFR